MRLPQHSASATSNTNMHMNTTCTSHARVCSISNTPLHNRAHAYSISRLQLCISFDNTHGCAYHTYRFIIASTLGLLHQLPSQLKVAALALTKLLTPFASHNLNNMCHAYPTCKPCVSIVWGGNADVHARLCPEGRLSSKDLQVCVVEGARQDTLFFIPTDTTPLPHRQT